MPQPPGRPNLPGVHAVTTSDHPEMKCIRVSAETQRLLAIRATKAHRPQWQVADLILSKYLSELEEIESGERDEISWPS
jgi:hypothetical protein